MATFAVIRRLPNSAIHELIIDGKRTGDTSASMQTLGDIAEHQHDVVRSSIVIDTNPNNTEFEEQEQE